MKSLAELTGCDDPAISEVRKWVGVAPVQVELLCPSAAREQVLLEVQVSVRSVLGAIAYETGGVLIDGGWLRLLGSGHPRLTRTLASWNATRSNGLYLVADDAAGGFFAMNGGSLGTDMGKMYYLAPDSLRWEQMNMHYSQFVQWCMTEHIHRYYESLRWEGWRQDVKALHGDRCFSWFPPLWTRPDGRRDRAEIPVDEAWDLALDLKSQLDGVPNQSADRMPGTNAPC